MIAAHAQLAWPREDQWQQPQRRRRDWLADEAVDRAQQAAQRLRIGNRSTVRHFRRLQRTP
jgi:hypothetical protein